MLIVFNPTAGGHRRRRLTRALDALAARGVRAEVVETERPGHTEDIARAAAGHGAPVVVAAGGDGTIAEVASGIAGSPATALGLVLLGTANVLAWELGVPAAPEAAAAVLASGHTALLRPGIARFADGRTRLFVQMLGAGFDAAVVASLDLGLKRRIGRGAYVWQAARELPRYRFPTVTAPLDGGAPVPVASAIVSKGRLYAGRHLLAPEARPGEAGFHVALFHRSGPMDAALCGLALLLGRLPRRPGVEIRRARRIDLAGEGAPAQADGDPAGRLPVAVTDAPSPIRVVLPRDPGPAR
jgi:diacylglycerol kinase family enzyme